MKLQLFFVLMLAFHSLVAQRTDEDRKQALSNMLEAERAKSAERKKRVEKYSTENKIAIWQRKEGENTTMLYDVDAKGNPLFYQLHSSEPAVTTGADQLNNGSLLGLNLRGDGMRIGVWDAGWVLDDHIELTGRVSQGDNAEFFSSHAGAVTGVILARGVNPLAAGMAPDAVATNFDFFNDVSEMILAVSSDANSLLLSNHSYGFRAGWSGKNWYGDPDISDQEDWLFGFYDDVSSAWDEITYNAPYFLPVNSSGNSRNIPGDGSYPPNGSYDVIAGSGVAKNNITVGAIQKIADTYKDPADAIMFDYSSWGPTDDGRIKPDLVGMGVDVLMVNTFNNEYFTSSGTSFSAPNVTGTLALLQELNKKLHGQFLKSATLKGLAIHTAHEAGAAIGPDYSFGWGVLNGVGAADMIIQTNQTNRVMKEVVLKNGETYSFDIAPKAATDVKVTICWTDLPGKPVEPQLDPQDLMLVNDLDMRVTNATEEHLPWILNPAMPSEVATKGDNFRDNVEKIEFKADDSGKYTITVGHKGTLVTGAQEFSIIVSYESDVVSTYYKVGNNSAWNNPGNWSATSGGAPAGKIPGPKDIVILDDETFHQLSGTDSTNEKVIFSLDSDVEIERLIVFSDQEVDILMNGHDLVTNKGLMLTNDKVQFKGEGDIILRNAEMVEFQSICGAENSFSEANITIDFENPATASVCQNLKVKSLTVAQGGLNLDETEVAFGKLLVKEEGTVNATNSKINIAEQLEILNFSSSSMSSSEILFQTEGTATLNLAGADDKEQVVDNVINVKVESGELIILSDITLSEVDLAPGTVLTIFDGKTVNLFSNLLATGSEDAPISIQSTGNSTIILDTKKLICLDHISVSNVNTSGEAIFNAGPTSTIVNATGWQSKLCEEVVFASFRNGSVCANSSHEFEDKSTGKIDRYRWFVDGEIISEEPSPTFQFPEEKSYEVRLEVEDAGGTVDSFTKTIEVVENDLPVNEVIFLNGSLLSADNSATSYQWFRDNVLLEGETRRFTSPGDAFGTYFVVTTNGKCNRKSADFRFSVTAVEEDIEGLAYNVYPNPAGNLLNVSLESRFLGMMDIVLVEVSGRVVYNKSLQKQKSRFEERVDTSALPDGMYVIVVSQDGKSNSKLVTIRRH